MRKYFILIIILLGISACGNLPKEDNYIGKHYSLLDQNGDKKVFPDLVNGKIAVVSYFFTNCPDICPLTTNNMRMIQEQVKKEKLQNIQFVSISFDPEVDRPGVLKKYAKVRNLDLSNWTFLTGDKSVTDSLIKSINFLAVVGDSTVFDDGSKTYYYVHTDRIQLIDNNGYIRGNYPGSALNLDTIMKDLRELAN